MSYNNNMYDEEIHKLWKLYNESKYCKYVLILMGMMRVSQRQKLIKTRLFLTF